MIEPMRSEWRLRLNALYCALVALFSLNFCSFSSHDGISGALYVSIALCVAAILLLSSAVNKKKIERLCGAVTLLIVLLTVFLLGKIMSDYDHMPDWVHDPCRAQQPVQP